MTSYAGTTIVKARTTVRRERLLPGAGDVVAKSGQQVSPMQVVARMPRKMDFRVLRVSEILRIPSDQLSERLLVKEGEDVSVGTVLVEKRGLFGKAFMSPVDGTMFRVRNGRVILQRSPEWTELRAMMAGRVVSRVSNRGVILEADGALIQGIWSSGKDGFGNLAFLSDKPDTPVSLNAINDDATGHVLAVAVVDSMDVLTRAAGLDVLGMIVGSMTAELCQAAETLPFPVIVTDGVGHRRMAEPIFDLLMESEGREVSLFGVREESRLQRPEIVIADSAAPKFDPPVGDVPIAVGQTVRILRSPYSSQIGEVVKVFALAQQTAVGTKAHGANVKLRDGHVAFVPFTNLDILIT